MRANNLDLESHSIPDALYNRRIHEYDNGWQIAEEDKRDHLRVIKNALDRQRAKELINKCLSV